MIGFHKNFAADNGFVPRVGYVQPSVSNRFTWYGAPGALVALHIKFVQKLTVQHRVRTFINHIEAKVAKVRLIDTDPAAN